MAIFGVGIDAVEVERVDRLLKKFKKRFLDRLFTPGEQQYCQRKAHVGQHLAARVAAKEAFVKALGTGFRGGIAWNEIEVGREKGGRPCLVLHGRAKEKAAAAGVSGAHLSLSHTDKMAFAEIILEVS
ncbi:MAG: holo-ACP synthase [Nitrospirae bacterium]|nr:holo-ACP synthase [Nitrospirota bacterium]